LVLLDTSLVNVALSTIRHDLGASVTGLQWITHAYPDPARRGFAVGIWSSTAAVAFATSPLLAGLLIAVGGWRAVFAVNLPFAMAVVALLVGHVRETTTRIGHGMDLPGQCAAMIALASLTYALIESGPLGWTSPAVIRGLTVFVIATGIFVGRGAPV
jgi:MFS transporter, DHA2 family, methylenomycin A resistance protein